MPLTEEEKQALQEKYKEHRQAMWEGRRTSRRLRKDDTPVSDTDILEGEEIANNLPEIPHRQGPRVSQECPDDTASMSPDQSDNFPDAKTTILPEQHAEIHQRHRPTADGGTSHMTQEVRLTTSPPTTQDAPERRALHQEVTFQVRDRIDVSEEAGQQPSLPRARRRRRRRKAGKKEREFWTPVSKEDKGPSMLTWKLALGVVGAIVILIGVGVLLGYWFAS